MNSRETWHRFRRPRWGLDRAAVELIRLTAELAGERQRPALLRTLETDAALEPLRSEPAFVELIETLQQ